MSEFVYLRPKNLCDFGRFPGHQSSGASRMTTSDGSSVFYLVVLLSLGFLTWISWNALRPHRNHSSRSVAILVLGDIGRSPRMMYHAQSFAESGFTTHLIGYGGRPYYTKTTSLICMSFFLRQAQNLSQLSDAHPKCSCATFLSSLSSLDVYHSLSSPLSKLYTNLFTFFYGSWSGLTRLQNLSLCK
jgi:hypothetical protein